MAEATAVSRARPGQRVGGWILESLIGTGSFGEVWRAHHHLFKADRAAIKVANCAYGERALRYEPLALKKLQHPNIARVLDADPFDDPPYIVLEYVDGQTLREILRKGPLDVSVASCFAEQILAALSFAHELGILHHDLKPENVLVGADQSVKLVDFGLSSYGLSKDSVWLSASIERLEGGAALRGTLPYMSPEQLQGNTPDARTDLYAFGMVWFELLVGRLPSGRDELPSSHRPELSAVHDRVYVRATASLENRARTAKELEAELCILQHSGAYAWSGCFGSTIPDGEPGTRGACSDSRVRAASEENHLRLIENSDAALHEQMRISRVLDLPIRRNTASGMTLILTPPGRFWMGASPGDTLAKANERPRRIQSVDVPLYVSAFPVTNRIVQEFLDDTGAPKNDSQTIRKDRAFAAALRQDLCAPGLPCTGISLIDADLLRRWLSIRDALSYRLPTEVEWEFFARSGSVGPYWWGEYQLARRFAVFDVTAPASAAAERANPWGLIDILGNVAEWTSTVYAESPEGPAIQSTKSSAMVIRGGSWCDSELACLRVSRRQPRHAATRLPWLGVRFVVQANCENGSDG